jgi:hypothetical protein
MTKRQRGVTDKYFFAFSVASEIALELINK